MIDKIYSYSENLFKEIPDLFFRIREKNLFPNKVEFHLPPKSEKLCWLNCKYCYTQTELYDEERISGERIVELIEEISLGNKKQIPNKIILSGFRTDPLNSNCLEDVLSFSKIKKFSTGIHTKGLVLKDNFADLVTSNNFEGDYITFSIDSGNNKNYCIIHGIENENLGLYSRVLENVKNLVWLRNDKNSNLKIRATYLLTDENSGENVDNFLRDFKSLGLDSIRFSIPIFPKMGSQKRNTIHSEISQTNLDKFMKIINKENYSDKNIFYKEFPSNPERVLPCYTRYLFPSIGYDGYLYPCCTVSSSEFKNLRIADLKKENFWEGYFRDVELDFCKANCQCDRTSADVNNFIKSNYSNSISLRKEFSPSLKSL